MWHNKGIMNYINLPALKAALPQLQQSWQTARPFRHLYYDGFFYPDKAELVLQQYPEVSEGVWDGTTYIHQRNKFTKRKFDKGSVLQDVFDELNSEEFVHFLEKLTGIQGLSGDEKLFGGGLHQSIKGAFLDVHVDFNYNPETKYHRRLNVLVYMNKDWKDEYEGHLQLWDMQKREMVSKIAPIFNRMAMFETNEVSFHGHPEPLNTPAGISRKSLAVYFYTPNRPKQEVAADHNTIFVNTEGLAGKIKTLFSGLKALKERLFR